MADDSATQDRPITREEGLSKNPIRDRMLLDEPTVSRDELHEIVARARDFFHSFLGQTIHRSYKRPPIYLVDDWVTTALGYFTVVMSSVEVDESGGPRAEVTPGAQERGSAFAGVYQLFTALREYRGALRGLSVIRNDLLDQSVIEGCYVALAERAAGLAAADGASHLAATLASGVEDARAVEALLAQNLRLHDRTNSEFFREFETRTDELKSAVARFLRSPSPEIYGVSFGSERFGGLLLEDIPELDIQAPAIVLAPRRIALWAESMPLPRLPKLDAAHWYGARKPESLGFAIALANVLLLPSTSVEVGVHRLADGHRERGDSLLCA
jgi:hypothetical protein